MGEGKTPQEPEPVWRRRLSLITNAVRTDPVIAPDDWASGREILYLVDPEASRTSGKLAVEICYRERTMKGEWGKIKSQRIPMSAISTLRDPADQQILAMLSGARDGYWPGYDYHGSYSLSNRFALSTTLQQLLLPLMCATGRCVLRSSKKNAEMQAIEWDDAGAWQFWLTLQLDEATNEYELRGVLRRASQEMEVASAILTTQGIVIGPDLRAAKFDSHGARVWTDAMRKSGELRIPAADSNDLIAHLLELPTPPNLDVPEDLQVRARQFCARASLDFAQTQICVSHSQSRLEADLLFDYPGMTVNSSDPREGFYDRNARRFVERDRVAEESAVELLKPLGFRGIQRSATSVVRQTPAARSGNPSGNWLEGRSRRQVLSQSRLVEPVSELRNRLV